MKFFNKTEIENTRSSFEGKKFPRETLLLHDFFIDCYVLPQSINPELPDFILRMTSKSKRHYLFGISESVPQPFRQYAVAHEVMEFLTIGIETPHRCVRALEKELILVPEEMKPEYMEMRRRFFGNLIPYASRQPAYFTPQDLEEFQDSFRRLTELTKK